MTVQMLGPLTLSGFTQSGTSCSYSSSSGWLGSMSASSCPVTNGCCGSRTWNCWTACHPIGRAGGGTWR